MEKKKAPEIRFGEFEGEWRTKTLGYTTKIFRGKRLVRNQLSTLRNDNFPVYQNSLFPLGYYEKYNCAEESSFVIAAGNAGDIGYSKTAFWAADDCYYFEHNDIINQQFLWFNHFFYGMTEPRTD